MRGFFATFSLILVARNMYVVAGAFVIGIII